MKARVLLLTACFCQATWLPLTAQEDPIVSTEDPAAALPQVHTPPAVVRPLKPPANRVLDPSNILTPEAQASITGTLNQATASGLSLYGVFLKTTDGLAEQNAAHHLAVHWQDQPLTAVFLHVPGQALTLDFSAPHLPSLQQDEIRLLTQEALQTGLTKTELPDQVNTAARHLTDRFQQLRSGQKDRFPTNPQKLENPIHRWIFWGGVTSIVFLLGLLLILRRRRAYRPRLFPLTAPRPRFSAPHSGGSNAMIRFDSGTPDRP